MKQKQKNTAQTNNITKKITNWKEYNHALENRGNFTVFLNTAYLNNIPRSTGKVGHPVQYTDAVVLFVVQLREFMRLPIRQSIGIAKFILKLAGLDMPLPSRSTISRRLGSLSIPMGLEGMRFHSPIILLPDSTGLKLSGEGEWKVKKHGAESMRKWVKLHIGVDHATQAIVSSVITPAYASDGMQLKRLVRHTKQACGHGKGRKIIAQIIADGAYDGRRFYQLTSKQGINLLVPPPKNAMVNYSIKGNDVLTGKLIDTPEYETRNNYIRGVEKLGKAEWKNQSGYHRRSLAETAMSRLKRTFGGELRSRLRSNQAAETRVRISLLNQFSCYGLPRYSS